ncbi:hypothetical protein ACRALDRAFT_213616 [Sodiomyces alcalophilus JCM 7366]|uniref:uncharacterized protein n=1 Tax=Sodiomyces alcalophilus JCM 7366 TaxID=591952 RepID=UPI0039B536F8
MGPLGFLRRRAVSPVTGLPSGLRMRAVISARCQARTLTAPSIPCATYTDTLPVPRHEFGRNAKFVASRSTAQGEWKELGGDDTSPLTREPIYVVTPEYMRYCLTELRCGLLTPRPPQNLSQPRFIPQSQSQGGNSRGKAGKVLDGIGRRRSSQPVHSRSLHGGGGIIGQWARTAIRHCIAYNDELCDGARRTELCAVRYDCTTYVPGRHAKSGMPCYINRLFLSSLIRVSRRHQPSSGLNAQVVRYNLVQLSTSAVAPGV